MTGFQKIENGYMRKIWRRSDLGKKVKAKIKNVWRREI